MATVIVKGISRPNKRESRPTMAVERLPNCLLAGDKTEDSSTTLRLQLLTDKIGLTFERARLLAGIAWGGAHG